MTQTTLPSGGGAWRRETDGSLTLIEEPTGPAEGPRGDVTPVEAPVQEGVEAPVKRSSKEAK